MTVQKFVEVSSSFRLPAQSPLGGEISVEWNKMEHQEIADQTSHLPQMWVQ